MVYTFSCWRWPIVPKRQQSYWTNLLSCWCLILCSTLEKANRFVEDVRKKFKNHHLGFFAEVLRMHLRNDIFSNHLYNKKSEDKIFEENEVSSVNVLSTPIHSGFKLSPLKIISNAVVIDKYRRLSKKILYLSRCVRLDICIVVNLMARYATKYIKTLRVYLKMVLKYLRETQFKIFYKFEKSSAKKITSKVHV